LGEGREYGEGTLGLERLTRFGLGRWKVMAAFAAIGLLGSFIVGMRQPARYRASCTVLIPGTPESTGLGGVSGGPRSFTGFFYYLHTQIKLISTRPVAQAAAARLSEKDRARLGSDPAGAILGGLSVERPQETLLLNICYVSKDRQLASAVANAVAEVFTESGLDRWRRAESGLAGELERRVERLEEMTAQRRRALAAMHDTGDGYGADEQSLEIAAGRAAEYRERVSACQIERIDLESQAKLVAGRAGSASELIAIPAVAADPAVGIIRRAIAQIEARGAVAAADFGPGSWERAEISKNLAHLRRRLDEAAAGAAGRLTSRLDLVREREKRLMELLAAAEGSMREIAVSLSRQESLSNEIAMLVGAREEAVKRRMGAELASRARVSGMQIVEPAGTAHRTGYTGLARSGLLGLLAGLLIGIGTAVLIEALDDRVRSPEELVEIVSEGLLGAIPRVEREGGRWEADLTPHLRPRSAGAEAAKGVRAQLVPLLAGGSKALVVTSPAPREGKSTVATMLAIVMAQTGRRTVLVDADMRRGRLHRSFELERSPGLSEYLAGEAGLHMVVRPTAAGDLSIIASGAATERAAELCESEEFGGLIERLKARHDFVIIDAPPVLPVADSIGLSLRADGVLVVVQSERTLRRPLARAVELLRRSGAALIGAVANDVRPSSSYYYDRKYGYGYRRQGYGRSERRAAQ